MVPLPVQLVLADSGKGGEVVVEVFENEAYFLGSGWRTPQAYVTSDRARFSSEDGRHEAAVLNLDDVRPAPCCLVPPIRALSHSRGASVAPKTHAHNRS